MSERVKIVEFRGNKSQPFCMSIYLDGTILDVIEKHGELTFEEVRESAEFIAERLRAALTAEREAGARDMREFFGNVSREDMAELLRAIRERSSAPATDDRLACPDCQGAGSAMRWNSGEPKRIPCSDCGGTGKVEA